MNSLIASRCKQVLPTLGLATALLVGFTSVSSAQSLDRTPGGNGPASGGIAETAPDKEGPRPKKADSERKPLATPAIGSEQERVALDFARTHHPELVVLLERLKQQHPAEYRAGLTEVYRAAERLNRLAEKFPDKYEFDLADWKLTSRIRLLAARLKMGADDPTLDPELRALLHQRFENRLAAIRSERDKSQKKAEKLQQALDDQASRVEEIVEKELKALRANPQKSPGSDKPDKPAKPKEIRRDI